MADLVLFQRLVADALLLGDPVGALRAARDKLPPDLSAAIDAADPDGVRMTALMIARLRFERLMQGSRRAADRFEKDPAGFAEAFRRYHAEVAPTAHDPRGENRLFERWCNLPS